MGDPGVPGGLLAPAGEPDAADGAGAGPDGRGGRLPPGAELFDTLKRLVTDRAALPVSHRFSAVRMADRIHVPGRGRIIHSGSHEEPLRQDGTYARHFRLQAAPYRTDEAEASRPGF